MGTPSTATSDETELRFCDEFEGGFGWIDFRSVWMERASHALVVDDRVWIVDAVDGPGIDDRVLALGTPAGVVQLLDRHQRDCALVAKRLDVPLHVASSSPNVGLPFEVLSVVDVPRWHEVALWRPEEATLVVADAVGTAPHYISRGERLAVNPLLRLIPPRRLLRHAPRRLLMGHGVGIEGDETALLLEEAIRTARRRLPAWIVGQGQRLRERR